MPPRRKKEETVTTTEDMPTDKQLEDMAHDTFDTANQADEQPSTDETPAERTKVTAADAVFYSDFEDGAPPANLKLRSADYEPSPYDHIMDELWQRYVDKGKPAWSLSNQWTKDDKPADGWYSEDPAIWKNVLVADTKVATILIKRAAARIGESYRIRIEDPDKTTDDGTKLWRVYFAAAPLLRNVKVTTADASTVVNVPEEIPAD